MSDFSDLKAAFKATVSGVRDVAKDIASSAGDKAKSVGRIAKLSMELGKEKENLQSAYAEIGKLYYESNQSDPGEFYIQLFDEVRLSRSGAEAIEAELEELKAAVGEGFTDPIVEQADSFEDAVAQAENEADVEVEIFEEPKE